MGSTTCLAAHKMRYEQFLKISVHTQLLLQADGQIAAAKEKRCCKTTKLICCSINIDDCQLHLHFRLCVFPWKVTQMLLGLLYSEHDASSLGNMRAPSICVSLAMVHWQLPRSYTQDRCSNGVEINNRLLSGDQLLSVCYPCFSVFHSVVLYIQTAVLCASSTTEA